MADCAAIQYGGLQISCHEAKFALLKKSMLQSKQRMLYPACSYTETFLSLQEYLIMSTDLSADLQSGLSCVAELGAELHMNLNKVTRVLV